MKTRLWVWLALVTFVCAGVVVWPTEASAAGQGAGVGSGESPAADRAKAVDKMIESKLSADLLMLYGCSQQRAAAATDQTCKLPPSGTVEVEVKLTAGSSDLDQKLTAVGIAIKSGGGTAIVNGEIAISNLKSLVEIAEVSSVNKRERQVHHLLRPT
jgi:hypothetical protein